MLKFPRAQFQALFLQTLPSFLSDFIHDYYSFNDHLPAGVSNPELCLNSWATETKAGSAVLPISAEAPTHPAAQAKPAWFPPSTILSPSAAILIIPKYKFGVIL